MAQVERLRQGILSDSARVQETRAQNWMRFDARLLLVTSRYAFQRLAAGTAEPFDFSILRQQSTIPESIEVKNTGFLELCLLERVEANFTYASEVVALSLL
jgi:hypothetical protein